MATELCPPCLGQHRAPGESLSFHDSSGPWHGLSLQRRNWFGLAEIIPSGSAGVPCSRGAVPSVTQTGSRAGLSHFQQSTSLLSNSNTQSSMAQHYPSSSPPAPS